MTAETAKSNTVTDYALRKHRSLWSDVWIQFRKHRLAMIGLVPFV